MAAGEPFGLEVLPRFDVGEGEVSQEDLSGTPRVAVVRRAAGPQGLAEERELDPELLAGRGTQGDRQVPPLAAEPGVRPVIRREGEGDHAVGHPEAFVRRAAQHLRQPEALGRRVRGRLAAGREDQDGHRCDPSAPLRPVHVGRPR